MGYSIQDVVRASVGVRGMSANDRQVGGDHYAQRDKPQHWDLVQMYGWDYFQGQITKYLMRWKTKHDTPERRLEDLKKAAHFLQKYIELQEGDVKRGMEPKKSENHIVTVIRGMRLVIPAKHPDDMSCFEDVNSGARYWSQTAEGAANLRDAELNRARNIPR